MRLSSLKSFSRKGVALIAALVIGLVVGIAGGSIAFASTSNHSTTVPSVPPVARNAQGLTYGSALNARSPEEEPDLVQAEATSGEIGYVLRTDLEEPTPKSPQEALARQASEAGKTRVIPVCESDGVTKIGVFVVQVGSPTPPLGK